MFESTNILRKSDEFGVSKKTVRLLTPSEMSMVGGGVNKTIVIVTVTIIACTVADSTDSTVLEPIATAA